MAAPDGPELLAEDIAEQQETKAPAISAQLEEHLPPDVFAAPASPPKQNPDLLANPNYDPTPYLQFGLVVAPRPADVMAIWNWGGGCNYDILAEQLTCVFRNWEDRFGARLKSLAGDWLDLKVSRPLRTEAAALKMAAEHLAICPDVEGHDLEEQAAILIGATNWYFWWD